MSESERANSFQALPTDVEQAIRLVHSSPSRAVLYITGGASQALAWLLCVPGASSTVLEAVVPYSRSSMIQLCSPGTRQNFQFVSASAAAMLAAAAYRRAVTLADVGAPVVGVAATCALVSSTEKRGTHRAHVATHSDHVIAQYELVLRKGARSRVDEDNLTARLVIDALLDACNTSQLVSRHNTMALVRDKLIDGDLLSPPIYVDHANPFELMLSPRFLQSPAPEAWNNGQSARVIQFDGGRWRVGAASTTAVLPGSFNPLHAGHRGLVKVAKDILGPEAIVGYELAVANADKPSLDAATVQNRSNQFIDENAPLVLTRAPLFKEKAELLPNHVFIVGYDTAKRVVEPRYYGGEALMFDALLSIAQNGCRFLVAGRQVGDDADNFLTLDDIIIPKGFERLFQQIPEEMFRENISSTVLRRQQQHAPQLP